MKFLIILLLTLCSSLNAYKNGFSGFLDDVWCLGGIRPTCQMKSAKEQTQFYLKIGNERMQEARIAFKHANPEDPFSITRAQTAYDLLCFFTVDLHVDAGYGQKRYFREILVQIKNIKLELEALKTNWQTLVKNANGKLGKPETCEQVKRRHLQS